MPNEDQSPKETTPPETAPPETEPPETEPPKTKPPETEPPEAESSVTTEPLIRWAVALHCEIPFKVEVFLAAWQTRLHPLRALVDYEASDEKTTIFDVEMFVQASSNARAASMASGLLKRHFDNLVILEMLAEPSKD